MGLRGGCIAASYFAQKLPSDPFATIFAFGGNKKSSFNITIRVYSCYYKAGFDSIGGFFCFFDSCPLLDHVDDVWHSPKETFLLS